VWKTEVKLASAGQPIKVEKAKEAYLYSAYYKLLISRHLGITAHGHIVLDGDPTPPPPQKREKPPIFRTMSIVVKRLDWMDQDGTC